MAQTLRIEDVIADPQALADATQAFRDVDRAWDGQVEVKPVPRSYYGHIHCWAVKACGTAYLVAPVLCHAPYSDGPEPMITASRQIIQSETDAIMAKARDVSTNAVQGV